MFVSPKVWNTIFLCDFIIRESPAKVKDTHLSSCLPFVGELAPEATERFFSGLALSVTCGDTSPKGRGKNFPAGPWLSLWESWRVSA